MKLKAWLLLSLWMMGVSATIFAGSVNRVVADSGDETLPMIGDPAPGESAEPAPAPTPAPTPVAKPKRKRPHTSKITFSDAEPAPAPVIEESKDAKAEVDPVKNDSSSNGNHLFHVGVEGGMSLGLSSFNVNGFSPVVTSSARVGFAGGVFAEYDVTDFLSIMPEVLYIQKGGRYSTFTDTYQLNWDSLEIPLLVKAKFGTDTMKFDIFAGPALSFAINQTLLDNYYPLPTPYYLKTFDIGVHAGVGGEFAITPSASLFLSGRYMQGFINQSYSFGVSQTLSGFLFMTGVSFGM